MCVPAASPSAKSWLPRFLLLAADTPIVGIIMESDSDLPVMNDAARTLSDFGVPYEVAFWNSLILLLLI